MAIILSFVPSDYYINLKRIKLKLYIANWAFIKEKIKPGVGIRELKFGITREIFGKPESCEEHSYSSTDKDLTETWNYPFTSNIKK